MRHLLASVLRRAAGLAVGLAHRLDPHVMHKSAVQYPATATVHVPTGGWELVYCEPVYVGVARRVN